MKNVIIILLLITGLPLYGQVSLETAVSRNYRTFVNSDIDPGPNGAALTLSLQKDLKETMHYKGGLEVGAAGVANYLALTGTFGVSSPLKWNNIFVGMDVFTRQGTGLFHHRFMYTWGLGESFSLSCQLPSGGIASVFLGFTYYSYPEYKEYSSIYTFLDLNFGLRYSFRSFHN